MSDSAANLSLQPRKTPGSIPLCNAHQTKLERSAIERRQSLRLRAASEALRHGASPNARGFYDMSPLLWAVSRHDLPMAKLLLDHGANPNQPKEDRVTPVFLAAVFPPKGSEDLTLTSLLVDRGADVNRPDELGQTPLLWVAFYGHIAIADYLLQHGADVNAVDRFGQTPLSMAEGQHRYDMISFLISHGATKR